jgi:hypothetical protein
MMVIAMSRKELTRLRVLSEVYGKRRCDAPKCTARLSLTSPPREWKATYRLGRFLALLVL